MKKMEAAAAEADRPTEGGKPRVRDRIFDTACDMFYRQGIRAVGVDAIANEAGTNKMSFYRSFPSKDELVAEYLRDSVRRFWEWWDAIIAPHAGQPRAQIEALFDAYICSPCENNDRGCAMANAAAEIREEAHPGLCVVRDHKSEMRRRFRKLSREMGAHNADVLGDGLTLLLHGAYESRLVFPGKTGPGANVARVAKTLIEAHLA